LVKLDRHLIEPDIAVNICRNVGNVIIPRECVLFREETLYGIVSENEMKCFDDIVKILKAKGVE